MEEFRMPFSPAGPVWVLATFFPNAACSRSAQSYLSRPQYDEPSLISAPSLSILSTHFLSPGSPSNMMAATPRRPSFWEACPPTLDSLMPPVRGLLAPTDSREELGDVVPASNPGAMTSLLAIPSASVLGSTSLLMMAEVRALPPKATNSSGISSKATLPSETSTLKIRLITPPCSLVKTVRVLLHVLFVPQGEKANPSHQKGAPC